jgi:NitT/TauT family transport system substrate-binding protein
MIKKITLLALIIIVFGLQACNSQDQTSILTPSGAPALAQIYLQEEGDNYSTDIVNGPDALVAGFGSKSYDFIFAPTNLGAKLYNNDIGYLFVAAITFGNYYLATVTEEDFTLDDLEGKEIICFGQNATSDIILKYILSANEIDASIIYVDSVASANGMLIADNSKIILSAEPALSSLRENVEGINLIDIQDEYQKISGFNSYPQSGVFARADLSDKQINSFLLDLENSIIKVNSSLQETALLAIDLEYGFAEEILISAIPGSNISFISAGDVKEDLENYFNIIIETNPALLGNALPDDDFYF